MAKLLDFAHWKLKSMDGDKALLSHKDGHSMHIAVQSLPKIQQEQIKRLKFADGGGVSDTNEGAGLPPAAQSARNLVTDFPRRALSQEAVNPLANPSRFPAPAAQPEAQPQEAPQADAAPIVDQSDAQTQGDIQQGLQGAVNSEAQALQTKAALEGKQSRAEAGLVEKNIQDRQKLADQDIAHTKELASHTDAFAKYLTQNPINEKHYAENLSTAGKVTGAIGLLLGGFSGGGRNPALDYLNKQIDRDIQSQRDRSDQQKTIWGAYHQLYGDQIVANNLAKVSLNDILLNKMKLAALKLGTPQAMAAYQLAQAQTDKNNAVTYGVTAQRITGLHNGTIKPEPGHAQQNSDMESKYGIKPLLTPGAAAKFRQLQYNPQAKPMYEELKKQYTAADQADKALANLGPTFEKLQENATKLGRIGQVGERLAGHVPAVGDAIAGIAKLPGEFQDETKIYNSAKTALISDITNALQGTNIHGDEILKIVNNNTPLQGDSKEVVKTKRDTIEGFIKRAVSTSFGREKGLTNQ